MLRRDRGMLHGRHHRRIFTGDCCSLHPSVETEAASQSAIDYAFSCIHRGDLITPAEALALAGSAAREKETLYSIAQKFSQNDEVDLRDVLCELGHRFPDYA